MPKPRSLPLLVLALACSPQSVRSPRCQTSADCSSGQTCSAGACSGGGDGAAAGDVDASGGDLDRAGGDTALAAGDLGPGGDPQAGDAAAARLPNGSDCTLPDDCASGFCADGVCCDEACEAPCRRCDAAAAIGACRPVVNSTDPGACDATSSCDTTGACVAIGGEACVDPVECASGFCSDGVCCDEACDGVCRACNLSGRGGSCSPVTDAEDADTCGGRLVCDTGGACAAVAGEGCQAPTDCASGYCADGVCCEAACTGGCEACAVAAGSSRNGRCDPLAGGAPGSCAGYACDGGARACPNSCTGDADCVAPFVCVAPACVGAFMLEVIKSGGMGTVTSSPTGIDCGPTCSAAFDAGITVTLTPVPAQGYIFTGWSGDCTGSAACQVTMSTARSVGARFSRESVTVWLDVTGTGAGRVLSDPPGIDCTDDCQATFPGGTVVTLTATPDAYSRFFNWGGLCSGSSPCTVTVDDNSLVTARFDRLTHIVTVTKSGNGAGSVATTPSGLSCSTTCTERSAGLGAGLTYTFNATPDALSRFDSWSGDCSGSTCSLFIDAPKSLGATFVRRYSFAIVVDTDPVTSGATGMATLTVYDESGQQLTTGGLGVQFRATGGTSTVTWSTTTDRGDGTYTATYTGVVAGTPTNVTARVNGIDIGVSVPLTVRAGSVSLPNTTVTTPRPTVKVGLTLPVSLTYRDAAGNPIGVGGSTVTFTYGGGSSAGTFGATTDNGDGSYTALLTGTDIGTPSQITGQADGTPYAGPSVAVVARGVSLVHEIQLLAQRVAAAPDRVADVHGSTVWFDTTNELDGSPTFELEIIGNNRDSVAHGVRLLNDSGAVLADIQLPGEPNDTFNISERYTVPIAPSVGTNVLHLQLDQAPNGLLWVGSARIVVTQTAANKTRIRQHMMLALDGSSGVGDTPLDTTSSTVFVQPTPELYGTFVRGNDARGRLATGFPWQLDVVLASDGGGSAEAALFNVATDQEIAGTRVSTSSTTPQLLRAGFANPIATWTEGQVAELRIRANGGTATVYSATTSFSLNPIDFGNSCFLIGRVFVGSGFSIHRPAIDESPFSNPSLLLQAEGTGTGSATLGTCTESAGTYSCNYSGANRVQGFDPARPTTLSRSVFFTGPQIYSVSYTGPTGAGTLRRAELCVSFY